MKKLTAVGLVAGAALGALLMAGPAQAHDHGHGHDVTQTNENNQLIPVQLCNTNVAVLIGANQSQAEDCYNGPAQGNIHK